MPDDKKPVVGVTADTREHAQVLADAIVRCGGDPWTILPRHRFSTEDTLERIDGLVVSGGKDVHPRSYGKGPDDDIEPDEEQNAVELRILRAALDADLPTYCICRGMQTLNVTMGGRPVQAVSGHSAWDEEGTPVASYHRIYISPGSKLAAVVGSGGFVRVNSYHHQGMRDAQKSPHLMASAYSLEDGIIEALESPDHRWVIGVQFHPELRNEVPPHFDRLFQSLVERAAEYAHTNKPSRLIRP